MHDAVASSINKIIVEMQFYFDFIDNNITFIDMSTPWLEWLSDEDVAFMKRFILASGSLKDLATEYGVSYPTIRLRLDRLIEKIKVFESHELTSDFERTVRAMFAGGTIDAATLKTLLAAHQKELESHHATTDSARDDVPRPLDARGREKR